jgi:hypothetical protein
MKPNRSTNSFSLVFFKVFVALNRREASKGEGDQKVILYFSNSKQNPKRKSKVINFI